ncbi:MAG: RNA polymerase sigma factor [Acidimicrobiia bacterium]
MTVTLTDSELIDGAAAGDAGCIAALVRANQARIWRFLVRMLRDHSLAEDVAQETFIRMVDKLPSWRRDATFTTWLFQIARHAAIDAMRKRDRWNRNADLVALPSASTDAVSRVEILAALNTLPDQLREALIMIEVTGLKYREASEVLGVAEGTLKRRVFDARQRLADWMEEQPDAV